MQLLKPKISLGEFAYTYVPFGVLLIITLMAAEITQDLTYYRAIYAIRLATILFIPAIALYILPGTSKAKANYTLLLWTFSFLAYAVHFHYTVNVIYGSIPAVYAGQGIFIASANFLVSIWWGIDVFLAWFTSGRDKWSKIQSVAAHIYITLVFLVANIFLFAGIIRILGLLMAITVLIALIIRIRAKS